MANARLEQLDYYALLKVARGASADEIRDAFHRFARKYHPDKFVGSGAEDVMVQRAAEVYRRGAEAYRVLCDPRRRREYDAGLADGHKRYDASAASSLRPQPVASWPLRVRNPAARPFATKAEQAYKAGDWSSCLLNLRMAGNKDPNNAQIAALMQDVVERQRGA